jgi:carboxy-cis,cis-muconate cyclase
MRFSLSTLLLAVVPKVLGDKHYFFSGFFAGNVIAGVEFDDSTNDLTLVNNITVNASEGSK